jgi:hypothetical protein
MWKTAPSLRQHKTTELNQNAMNGMPTQKNETTNSSSCYNTQGGLHSETEFSTNGVGRARTLVDAVALAALRCS